MPASQKIAKKLPKRTGNAHRKAKRAASWAKYKEARAKKTHRKDRNEAANLALHLERVENGGLGRREQHRIDAGVRLSDA